MKEKLKICKNEKELLKKNYLKSIKKENFNDFNLIIGKNGSGKTRMLRFLKDVAAKQGNCNIIFLDCSENWEGIQEEEERIFDKIIFNHGLSRSSLENLFVNIKKQLSMLTPALENLHTGFESEADNIVDKINVYVRKMMERELYIEQNNLYIRNLHTRERKELIQEINFLSPGERNIIIFTMFLLSINLNVKGPSLLLIDEIETHLHPAVLLDLFKMLKENLRGVDCCVFIATHSVFLLPAFEFDEICYMNQGELLKTNGNIYKDILDVLVYGKDDDHSISELLGSVDSWSYAEFMAECFLEPTVSERVTSNDPQYKKMQDVIKELLEKNDERRLEVLDFGAGEVRIGMCMKQDYEGKDELPHIIYHVYDKYHIKDDFKRGEFVFGSKFTSKEEVLKIEGKMDIVLLYNVLHEIGIDEWCDELNLALSLLKKNGVLIFSERKTLSIGEKPYGKSGYLLLGEEEIRLLFSDMDVSEIGVRDETSKIWAFAIRNEKEKRITADNVENALERLKTHTQEIIDGYFHQEKVDEFKARDYAFYCQQYFNAKMAQEILEKERIPEMRLQFILNLNIESIKKRELLQKRAEIDDEEGARCQRYLDENPE